MEIETKRRNRLINQIEHLYKYARKIDDKTSINSITTRLANLSECYKLFNESKIELLQYAEYESVQAKIDEFYYETKSLMEDALDVRKDKEKNSSDNLNETLTQFMLQQKTFYASVNEAHVKLPKLNIEPFSGEYCLWPSFKDLFVTAVHNNSKLSGSCKLQVLKGLLRGEAASLIRHITTTDQNYEEAWQKLDERYNKPKPIIAKLLQEFLEQKSVATSNYKDLRKLYNRSDEIVRSLRSIDQRAESRDVWLIHLVVGKTDIDTKQLWAQNTTHNPYPTFEEFLRFLNSRCDALESCSMGTNKPSKSPSTKLFYSEKQAQEEQQQSKQICPVCSDTHLLYKCPVFRNKSISDRCATIKQQNLCQNCLRKGHFVGKCPYRTSCLTCHKKHHTLLHAANNLSLSSQQRTNENKPNSATSTLFCCHNNKLPAVIHNISEDYSDISQPNNLNSRLKAADVEPQTIVHLGCIQINNILPTAVVKVQSRCGNKVLARVLLDSGSQSNFVTESFIKQLRLSRERSNFQIHGLGSVSNGNTRGKARLQIQSRINPKYSIQVDVLIVKSITNKLPSTVIDVGNKDSLQSLSLADPMFF